jgi:hypothetical protein
MTPIQIKWLSGFDINYSFYLERPEGDLLLPDNQPFEVKDGMRFYALPSAI